MFALDVTGSMHDEIKASKEIIKTISQYDRSEPVDYILTTFSDPIGRLDSLFRFVFVWFGLVWFGLVLFGFVLFCLVWFGLVWFGLVWFGLVWFGLVWLLFSSLPFYYLPFPSLPFSFFPSLSSPLGA
jgi:hypothetical protein